MIGILRECFRHIPCVGFSATLTPIGITKFSRLMRMENPQIIHETVRRRNVKIWVARIQGQNYDDLQIMIPDGISSAVEIPVTLIFVNGTMEATDMCEWFRTLLPTVLQVESTEIV
jgi:superfamily II DNA helicase RecQ